mgnify:CR=1 FL=1
MKLLASDTCLALLQGDSQVIRHYRSCTDAEVATTWLCAGELYKTAAGSADPEKHFELVTRLLRTLRVVSMNLTAAQLMGELQVFLHVHGMNLSGSASALVACALAYDAELITIHAIRYANVPGLRCRDWTKR